MNVLGSLILIEGIIMYVEMSEYELIKREREAILGLGTDPQIERRVLRESRKFRDKLAKMLKTNIHFTSEFAKSLNEEQNQWKVMGLKELGAATDKGELVIDKQLTLFKPLLDTMTESERRELYYKQEELMMFDFLYTPMSDWGENT